MNNATASRPTILSGYLLALLGAFLIVFVLVKAMQHYTSPPPVDQKRADERRKALADLRAANTQALANYDWQDQPKGVIRLPIRRAMELTLQEWKDPGTARSNLIARMEKANEVPPPPPEKPSVYE